MHPQKAILIKDSQTSMIAKQEVVLLCTFVIKYIEHDEAPCMHALMGSVSS